MNEILRNIKQLFYDLVCIFTPKLHLKIFYVKKVRQYHGYLTKNTKNQSSLHNKNADGQVFRSTKVQKSTREFLHGLDFRKQIEPHPNS